jgi:hypothetical protein
MSNVTEWVGEACTCLITRSWTTLEGDYSTFLIGGAGAKTSLGVCITEPKLKTCLILLVHFGEKKKKAM